MILALLLLSSHLLLNSTLNEDEHESKNVSLTSPPCFRAPYIELYREFDDTDELQNNFSCKEP